MNVTYNENNFYTFIFFVKEQQQLHNHIIKNTEHNIQNQHDQKTIYLLQFVQIKYFV